MTIRYDGRVAIVTGAGNGLGRCHALQLAARGAKVMVNDFGGARDGTGGSSAAAEAVAAEIRAGGGEAMANGADVSRFEQVAAMVEDARSAWGRVDILINNAGILRDKSFAKMELADFRAVVEVHLMGTVNCTKAVWEIMRAQNYGRVVLTTSGSGIYGNFGQANYGAAKAAMVGLMNVLHAEGAKNGIRVSTLAPTAATRMTAEMLPPKVLGLMAPEAITPAVLYLVSEQAPSRVILAAGAGCFAVTHILESEGVFLPEAERTPETIAARFAEIADVATARPLASAFEQTDRYVRRAAAALGVTLAENEPASAR
ncbi:MAG: SDR family NAD(P)-dependent oxidoreductase [Rhodospirillales bacterium]|nr:SDR family NAD(P)-dependent oxidoreductase [Rhodospirillales bacterium]